MGPCWTLPATVVVQHVSVLAPAGAAKWSVADRPGIPRLTASQPVQQGKIRVESLGKDIAGTANAIAIPSSPGMSPVRL